MFDFDQPSSTTEPPHTSDSLIEGCSPYTPRQTQTGPWIALISRGGCSFLIKAYNAAFSGASGVIIVDTSGNDVPPVMSANSNELSSTTPLHPRPFSAFVSVSPPFCLSLSPFLSLSPTHMISRPYVAPNGRKAQQIPSISITQGAGNAIIMLMSSQDTLFVDVTLGEHRPLYDFKHRIPSIDSQWLITHLGIFGSFIPLIFVLLSHHKSRLDQTLLVLLPLLCNTSSCALISTPFPSLHSLDALD